MGHWVFADQLFVHVCIKGELLYVFVFAYFDETFSALVTHIPKVLHDTEYPKNLTVKFHEPFSCELEHFGVA